MATQTFTFEDLTDQGTAPLPLLHGGLDWINLRLVQGAAFPAEGGFLTALASGDYAIMNEAGAPAAIAAPIDPATGTPADFDLVSGVFTAAWNRDLPVTVIGVDDGLPTGWITLMLTPDQPLVVDFTDPAFDSVDALLFAAGTGTPVSDQGSGSQFLIDDLTLAWPDPLGTSPETPVFDDGLFV